MAWQDVLAPLRFLATTGQFLVTTSLFFNLEPWLLPALPKEYSQLQHEAAQEEFQQVASLCSLCLAVELLALLSGCTMFQHSANILLVMFRAAGCVAVSALVAAESAHFGYLWYVFAFSCLPGFLLEMASFASIFWLHKDAF
mmetsp:Transcript_37682/g.56905  ORF Transcript_37682/g.56905 Transcript_37682/m.56905 type:complete len:142 (-) Transcript_37682:77-502(-)